MKDKLIGILGGMGPQASCELYRIINEKSIEEYKASRNADFPHLLLSNLPVPDLIGDKEAQERTVSMVKREAGRLESAGVTDLFLACNTMHLYAEEMFQNFGHRFHSLISLVAARLSKVKPSNVLLLGTKTTIATNLYQNALEKNEIRYSKPSEALLAQSVDMILDAIAGRISTGKKEDFYQSIEKEAQERNADLVLLACTELPLIIKGNIRHFPTVSSLGVLADAICELHYT